MATGLGDTLESGQTVVRKQVINAGESGDVEWINTVSELQKLWGISYESTRQRVARPDWTFGDPPWPKTSLSAMNQWVEDVIAPRRPNRPAPTEGGIIPLTEPDKIALMEMRQARTDLTKLKTQILAGDYLKRADVHAERISRILTVKSVLMRLPKDCVARMHFLDADQKRSAQGIIDDQVRAALNEFAGRDLSEAEIAENAKPPPEKPKKPRKKAKKPNKKRQTGAKKTQKRKGTAKRSRKKRKTKKSR